MCLRNIHDGDGFVYEIFIINLGYSLPVLNRRLGWGIGSARVQWLVQIFHYTDFPAPHVGNNWKV